MPHAIFQNEKYDDEKIRLGLSHRDDQVLSLDRKKHRESENQIVGCKNG